jgi:predicted aspartyl protease
VTPRISYKLNPHGRLFWTKAAFGSANSEAIITARLLIDTGASYTGLSEPLIQAIVGNPIVLRQQPIMTASDRLMAPVIAIPWMSCLGQRLDNFSMLALPLPTNAFIDGLIGIDFLKRYKAIIDIDQAEISVIYPPEK